MKLFLQIIFLFSCQLIFAQSTQSTLEKDLKAASIKISFDKKILKRESESLQNSKISTDKKSDPKKSVAEQDYDLEIRAILDYRHNRVLREDLFCLICEVGFDEGQLA